MEPDTVVLMITIVGSVLGSSLTTIHLLLRQMNHLDGRMNGRIDGLEDKFTGQIAALDTKFTGKIAALDTKFTGKFDAMGRDISDIRERLARVEGHLMAPEGFTLRSPRPPAAGEPPPEGPAPDHRRAS